MRARAIALVSVLAIAGANRAYGQDHWEQFRGPDGLGIAADGKALPVEFGPDRNVLWKCPVSSGHSSPCIWEDRVFLTGHAGEELETICIDRASGEVLWRRGVTVERFERPYRTNSLATPTPTTDGERVFVYFGSFGLLCYDFQGVEQWRRPTEVPVNMYGTAASPIVAGDYLIFNDDRKTGSYLEAIDRESGETIWRTEREGFAAGWSTPMPWRNDDVDEVVVYGVWWMKAYDLLDGSELWSVPGLTDEPCITPVTGEGLVFITSYNMKTNPEVIGLPEFDDLLEQYDLDEDDQLTLEEVRSNESILSRIDADGEGDHPLRGFFRYLDEDRDGKLTVQEWGKMIAFLDAFEHANALLAIRPGGEGERAAEIVWQHHRGVPECPSPLYYEGLVYLVKNGGIVTCLEAKTGELQYHARLDSGGPYYSSPVVGDGKIYAASARGVVTVFEVGDSLKVMAQNDLGERIMATPALVDGRVYVRTDQNLYAFGVAE